MSDVKREQNRHDKVIKGQFTKREGLIQRLQAKGVSATGNIKSITRLCQLSDLPIEEFIPEMVQGWLGKPKGMLQVLWVCGFIDVTNLINIWLVKGRMRWVFFKQKEAQNFFWEIALTLRKRNHYFSLAGESLVPKSTELLNVIVSSPGKESITHGDVQIFFPSTAIYG
jgi:hypothetical protein